jgi:hypothetical protein
MVSKAGRDAPATEFNLNEPCTALVLLELAPCEQPEGCTATIAWDGRDLQPLSRARFYTIDPSGDSSGRVTSSLGW